MVGEWWTIPAALAYRAFLGWRFDKVPIIDLAVEAVYTNFGKPSQTIVQGGAAQNVEFKLHGASLVGLLTLPLGQIDLSERRGYRVESRSDGERIDHPAVRNRGLLRRRDRVLSVETGLFQF